MSGGDSAHKLELRYTAGDRLTFTQISLPNNVLTVTSPTQTFTLASMPSTNDVRVALTYVCSVGGKTLTVDTTVNFLFRSKNSSFNIKGSNLFPSNSCSLRIN